MPHIMASRHVVTLDIIKASINPPRGNAMPTAKPGRTLDELTRLGEDIFDRELRPALKPEDDGKFVAVDVETGDYEIDEDDYAAVTHLLSRKPAADIWLMRAGYRAAYRIGMVR